MSLRTQLTISTTAALAIGALLAAFSPGAFVPGWLAASLLLFGGIFALLRLWRWAGKGRRLAWMLAAALLLRLALGTAVTALLPVVGYAEPEQKAGYLFFDAYMRDNQAWDLAHSGEPFWKAFGDEFTSDQYGGLLGLSALVYRVLSPDAHRPMLILVLGALAFTLGVPFFYKGVRQRWGEQVAAIATWILVLYPDGILFSSSQMREPFLIGLLCVAFWAVLAWGDDPEIRPTVGAELVSAQVRRHEPATRAGIKPAPTKVGIPLQGSTIKPAPTTPILAFLSLLAGLALFSSRVAAAAAVVLAVWFFLDRYYARLSRRGKLVIWVGFALLALAVLALTWEWFSSSAAWDFTLLDRVSGQWRKALQGVEQAGKLAALAIYGLVRPLLPAAIAATRPPWIWKSIDIFRSLGWWTLLPLLLYGGLAAWREREPANRRTLLWFTAVIVAWLLISSLRGGADQWDNPRYRTIFLPWLALLAGWGVSRARALRDAWLPRLLLVEAIFLGFFTQWYLSRYWTWLGWNRRGFWTYVIGIGVSSAVVILAGWLWDKWRARRVRP